MSDRRTPRALRREIAWALVLKLVLIVVIKVCFFSHPPAKTDVAERLTQRLGAKTAPVPDSASRQSTLERP
ncbi:cytochrome oxidase putative small subunit CydP [Denitratisoma sp. agr-D3]